MEYKSEFKLKVVKEHLEDGVTQVDLCKKYDLYERTLRRWVQKYKFSDTADPFIPIDHDLKGVSTMVRIRPDGSHEEVLKWVKSNKSLEQQNEIMQYAVNSLKEQITPLPKTQKPIAETCDGLLSLYVVTDYHMGQMSWAGECGESWDLEIAEQTLISWFEQAINAAPNSHTAVLGQLGDFLHYDSLKALTPTSGHVLDTESKYPQVVDSVLKIFRTIVSMLLAKHEHVHIIMAEGNHDLASSVWLRAFFDQLYKFEDRVTVDNTHTPYYCYEWGDTSLFFHHGHCKKMGSLSKVFAGEYREVFGRTKYSYAHMGHYHHVKSEEDELMIVRQHPTLAAKDSHSVRGGYNSIRSASVINYSKTRGYVGESSFMPEFIK